MSTEGSQGNAPPGGSTHGAQRAVPPIRWPHVERATLLLIGVWVIGMVIGLVVPAFVVPPGESNAPVRDVILALTITHVGALIMLGVGLVFHRRGSDPVATVFGIVPALAVSTGGFIMAATTIGLG